MPRLTDPLSERFVATQKEGGSKPSAARKQVRGLKSVHELAQEYGLSERQLYRLRNKKCGDSNDPFAGSRGFRISAHLLSELGHGDLLATDVQAYLAAFIPEFVIILGAHVKAEGTALDPRWAKGNAHVAIEHVRAATRRRQQKLQELIENE